MEFAYFKLLSVPVQAHILCERGVMLAEREEDGNTIVLYSVDGFYVEVYYRTLDSEIIKLRSFHSAELLEPYLGKISLDVLTSVFS
jgi:hypothetical protein